MKNNCLICSLLFASGIQNAWGAQITDRKANPDQAKPNIILIMCDDMGFSDLSCYGGEVHTPHIDFLAENGIRFSQFKNTGRSCPSRAALLTGRYQHEVGMGWMTAVDEHRPGYRGQISDRYPTIAEVFRENGYHTYMSGKWHVTVEGAFTQPNGSYPVERGFEKYYGCLSGGGSYYTPKPVFSGLQRITEFPKDYYYTTAITDSAVSFIRQHPVDEPMFMYLAHYAPHLPLQAPKERVEACREKYKAGYDVLRKQRFERIRRNGLIDIEDIGCTGGNLFGAHRNFFSHRLLGHHSAQNLLGKLVAVCIVHPLCRHGADAVLALLGNALGTGVQLFGLGGLGGVGDLFLPAFHLGDAHLQRLLLPHHGQCIAGQDLGVLGQAVFPVGGKAGVHFTQFLHGQAVFLGNRPDGIAALHRIGFFRLLHAGEQLLHLGFLLEALVEVDAVFQRDILVKAHGGVGVIGVLVGFQQAADVPLQAVAVRTHGGQLTVQI